MVLATSAGREGSARWLRKRWLATVDAPCRNHMQLCHQGALAVQQGIEPVCDSHACRCRHDATCMGPCHCVWLLQWIRGLLGFIAFGGLHDREAADCASMQRGAGCETRCHHQLQCMRCWSGCGDLIACTCGVSTSICETGRHLQDRYICRRRAPTMQSTVHNAT